MSGPTGWGGGPWGGAWGDPGDEDFPTFLNLSFEIAGSGAGLAAAWVLIENDPGGLYADWGPDPRSGEEDFERWFALIEDLSSEVTETAFFIVSRDGNTPHSSTIGFESFESGWPGTDTFFSEVENTSLPFSDDMETGWMGSQAAFIYELSDDTVELPGTTDTFELGWVNDPYFFELGSGAPPLATAVWGDGTPEESLAEDFEAVLFEFSASADPSTDSFFAENFGYPDSTVVKVFSEFGEMPGGVQNGKTYTMAVIDSQTFQLHDLVSGALIAISSTGTAALKVRPADPGKWYSKVEGF